MHKISLYQPRHSMAPEHGKGHVYLPSSLATVGSRILQAGGEIDFQDGNLREPDFNHGLIGMNVVGAPYIPVVIELRKKITGVLGEDAQVILGGQVINEMSGLTRTQFHRLFGSHMHNGNDDTVLKGLLGLELRSLPTPEETSLIPFYEKISDEDFKEYLEHEFCLYLSQGCKYGCEFCADYITYRDPVTGEVTKVNERYRNLDIIETELKYMVARAQKLGINTFTMYLSNLDTFQTPQKLKEFAAIVNNIKKANPGFTFKMRGLSTATAFMETYQDDKEVITAVVDAGLWSIGFGVDGTSKEIWKSIKKGHNQINECIEAIKLTREEFNITPEVFMVVGHANDTPETLRDDVEFILDMAEYYGAAPRPYVAKSIVPGNTGWRDPANAEYVEMFIQHPEYFQALDFCALPTSLTHPSAELRSSIEKTFTMLTNIAGNTTNIVYPISPDADQRTLRTHHRLNRGKFDR